MEKKKPAARRTSEQVLQLAKQAHALVSKGASRDEALARVGLFDSVFRNALKRLDLHLPPAGAQVGSMRADSLPPRPTGGKGGKRVPKPLDMNSVEALAKRMSKVDRLLHGVNDLKAERKKIATRLRSLLKV